MRVLSKITSFKGYDAVPLKRIFVDETVSPILPELNEIAKQENQRVQIL